MADKQVRRIPVVNENNYLVGMISMADVAVETHDDRELGDALEQISKSTSFWNRLFG
jgi:CBS domain-containing protein